MLRKKNLLTIFILASIIFITSGCGSPDNPIPYPDPIIPPAPRPPIREVNTYYWRTKLVPINDRKLLQIEYRKTADDYPQYAVLHLESGYFRMNYSAEAEWGTSIVIFPCFWKKQYIDYEKYYHSAEVSDYSLEIIKIPDNEKLKINVTGNNGGLYYKGYIIINPPTGTEITADVIMRVQNMDKVRLSPTHEPQKETFRPLMLSSMHISDDQWDTNLAFVGDKKYPIEKQHENYIIYPLEPGKTFGLEGGLSEWQQANRNMPAVSVKIDLDKKLHITGHITDSNNPNDDNIGFWAGTDKILNFWKYKITVAENFKDPFIGPIEKDKPSKKPSTSNWR